MKDSIKSELGCVRSGRRPKNYAPRKAARQRGFSESFLFTLGLSFIIVYFTGMLFASRGAAPAARNDPGAVPVFAEYDAEGAAAEEKETARGENLWDDFTSALAEAFGRSVDG